MSDNCLQFSNGKKIFDYLAPDNPYLRYQGKINNEN